MHKNKVNPLVQWWMTPYLPIEDIYELPLLKNKGSFAKYHHYFSQWLIHPIKRRLARWYLRYLQTTTNIKVVGITGSAGKSTTTQLLYSILKKSGQTVATPHSIDPVYNIPNTILHANKNTKYLILEMSVEFFGEMDYYLWLSKPDIGVILNIYPSHLKNFGNVNGVLREKSKLIKNLGFGGVAVLNHSDKLLTKMAKGLAIKTLWFNGSEDPLESDTNAAKKVAECLGISEEIINKGVSEFKNPNHRLELVKLKNGAKIIDDTYNSNPEAAILALNYFGKISKGSGNKIAVLGDMLELGDYEIEGHKRLGKKIAAMNFQVVVGVGKAIKNTIDEISKNSKTKAIMAKDIEEAKRLVKPLLDKKTFLFVKASRSIGLDKLVSDLAKM